MAEHARVIVFTVEKTADMWMNHRSSTRVVPGSTVFQSGSQKVTVWHTKVDI